MAAPLSENICQMCVGFMCFKLGKHNIKRSFAPSKHPIHSIHQGDFVFFFQLDQNAVCCVNICTCTHLPWKAQPEGRRAFRSRCRAARSRCGLILYNYICVEASWNNRTVIPYGFKISNLAGTPRRHIRAAFQFTRLLT